MRLGRVGAGGNVQHRRHDARVAIVPGYLPDGTCGSRRTKRHEHRHRGQTQRMPNTSSGDHPAILTPS